MRSYRHALVTRAALAALSAALVLAAACSGDDAPAPTATPGASGTSTATASPAATLPPRTATPAPTAPRPTATRPPAPTPLPDPPATPGRFTIQLFDFDEPGADDVRRGIGLLTATVDGVTCTTVDTDVLEPPAIVLGDPDQPEECRREEAWVSLFAASGPLEGERWEHFRLRLGTVALMGNYGPMPPHGTGEPWTGIAEYNGAVVLAFEQFAFYGGTCPITTNPIWLSPPEDQDFMTRLIEATNAPALEANGISIFRLRFTGERSPIGNYGHDGNYRYEIVPIELLSAELADDCEFPAAREFAPAHTRWRTAAITDYRFTLQRSCECPPEWSAPTEVVVRAGLVASATLEDGTPAPEGAALTIDAILDAIASALNEPVATAVTYHPELGYPLEVQLDLEAIAVDGGLSLTVSDFERLD